jgi:hypothetical protein
MGIRLKRQEREADHSPSSTEVKKGGAMSPLSHTNYAVLAAFYLGLPNSIFYNFLIFHMHAACPSLPKLRNISVQLRFRFAWGDVSYGNRYHENTAGPELKGTIMVTIAMYLLL